MERWVSDHWPWLSGLVVPVLGWLGRRRIAGWYRGWREVLTQNERIVDCENNRAYLMGALREITEAAALARSAASTPRSNGSSPAPPTARPGSEASPTTPTSSTR